MQARLKEQSLIGLIILLEGGIHNPDIKNLQC